MCVDTREMSSLAALIVSCVSREQLAMGRLNTHPLQHVEVPVQLQIHSQLLIQEKKVVTPEIRKSVSGHKSYSTRFVPGLSVLKGAR